MTVLRLVTLNLLLLLALPYAAYAQEIDTSNWGELEKRVLQRVMPYIESLRTVNDLDLTVTNLQEFKTVRDEIKEATPARDDLSHDDAEGLAFLMVMHSLSEGVDKTISYICWNDSCDKLVHEFPAEYRWDMISFSKITIYQLACAAASKGMFKKFNTDGFFSKLSLELESGTIYLKRVRMDLDTLQEVGATFQGENVYNFLLATEFESINGDTRAIRNSGAELEQLYMQFGGAPKNEECIR